MKPKHVLRIILIVQLHVKQPTVTNYITFNSTKQNMTLFTPLKSTSVPNISSYRT
jgi:hypothetical protein